MAVPLQGQVVRSVFAAASRVFSADLDVRSPTSAAYLVRSSWLPSRTAVFGAQIGPMTGTLQPFVAGTASAGAATEVARSPTAASATAVWRKIMSAPFTSMNTNSVSEW